MDAHTLSWKLNLFFENLKCAAKLNVAFGFMLKNLGDGICWYYYAHENNTLMERSKLVATNEGLEKITKVLSGTDVIQAFIKGRANTK